MDTMDTVTTMEVTPTDLPTCRQYKYLRYTLAHYGGAMTDEQRAKIEFAICYGSKGDATPLIRKVMIWRAEQDALLD